MGYYLQALLGPEEILKSHTADYKNAKVVPLKQGIGLIAINNKFFQEIGQDNVNKHFEKLSPNLEKLAEKISADGPVIYVEAEFFGGSGGQALLAWDKGKRTMRKPYRAPDAINEGLKKLGVQKQGTQDEFDTVDLGRWRSTEEWI